MARFFRQLFSWVILTFRVRAAFYAAAVLAASILYLRLPLLGLVPSDYRIVGAAILTIPLAGAAASAEHFFAEQISFGLKHWWYSRKHEPEMSYDPDVVILAEALGIRHDGPILITDDPIVNGPFTNVVTGTITVPRVWITRYTREQLLGALAHQLAHLKHRRRFDLELLIAGTITAVISGVFALGLPSLISILAEIGVLMIALTTVSQHNELRADAESREVMGAEPLISVLEDLGARYGFKESSETHPSIRFRISRLMEAHTLG